MVGDRHPNLTSPLSLGNGLPLGQHRHHYHVSDEDTKAYDLTAGEWQGLGGLDLGSSMLVAKATLGCGLEEGGQPCTNLLVAQGADSGLGPAGPSSPLPSWG